MKSFICITCNKTIVDYPTEYIDGDKTRPRCYKCYMRNRYATNIEHKRKMIGATSRNIHKKRISLIDSIGKRCARCGDDSLPYCCYEFHHKAGFGNKEKKFTLDAVGISKKSEEEIRLEIEKCELLCKNCHAIVHFTAQDVFIK